ncbi:MAG: hypothetical protein FJ096_01060 [Deltaproteobacteria bacterium]|nr:hypothetical protein [Deltaproteobacteria bacterium]
MRTRTILAALALATTTQLGTETASAEPAPVQRFLRGPWFRPSASTLRISPPRGGHVILHRDGKPARWFLQPAAIQVEPGVTYAVTAVRGDEVLFDSGVVARAGILDLVWTDETSTPTVNFHPSAVLNPFAVGLVPIGAVPVQDLRAPISEPGFQLMLDDLQGTFDDGQRWSALQRYTDAWLFTDEQIDGIVRSFAFPMFQRSAALLLERRRVTSR